MLLQNTQLARTEWSRIAGREPNSIESQRNVHFKLKALHKLRANSFVISGKILRLVVDSGLEGLHDGACKQFTLRLALAICARGFQPSNSTAFNKASSIQVTSVTPQTTFLSSERYRNYRRPRRSSRRFCADFLECGV